MLTTTLLLPSGYTGVDGGYIAVYNERLAIVLGLTTLFFSLATFFSCRSCVCIMQRLGWKDPVGTRGYRSFYRFHSYYWWAFLVVFALHAMTAIMHAGLPAAADPEAYQHRLVLWFGIGAFMTAVAVFASCRSLVILVDMFRSRSSLSVKRYRTFYGFHPYLWLLSISLAGAHFAAGYAHAGIWPR